MGKIWLQSFSPDKQFCGCAGKSGPCDGCCTFFQLYRSIILDTVPPNKFITGRDIFEIQYGIENNIENAIIASPPNHSNISFALTLKVDEIIEIFYPLSTNDVWINPPPFVGLNLGSLSNIQNPPNANTIPTINIYDFIFEEYFGNAQRFLNDFSNTGYLPAQYYVLSRLFGSGGARVRIKIKKDPTNPLDSYCVSFTASIDAFSLIKFSLYNSQNVPLPIVSRLITVKLFESG